MARDEGTAELFEVHQQHALGTFDADENPVTVVNLTGEGRVGEAHENRTEMTSLAFSSDGRLLATGSNDATARVWETASGRELLRAIHGSGVASVAFSSAGDRLATGDKDGNIRVLEVDTGHPVLAFTHEAEVREVTFSPEGRYLAAISTDGGVSLLNLETQQVLRAWHSGIAGLGLAFSRDGKKLATASGDFAFVWEVDTGKELLKVTHASSPDAALDHLVWVDDVALSPDGNYMASGGRDGTARVWNLTTGQELVRVKLAGPVETVAFSPDGTTLSTASFDGTARVWELPSGRERLRTTHPGGSEVVAFSPDGSHVASGGVNGAVKVWNLTRGDQMARMPHPNEVRVVGFSPDNKALATAYGQGYVRLWTPQGEPKSAPVKLPVVRIDRLIFSEDGAHLAVEWGNMLFLMDVAKELAATRLAGFHNAGDPALSQRYLAAWDRAHRSLRIWETAGGRELSPIEGGDIWKLAFDSTATFLATMQTDDRGNGVIRVWALPEGRDLGLMAQAKSSAKFALGPHGQHLAVEISEPGAQTYSVDRYVEVWDTAAATRVTRIPQDQEMAFIAFDPSGKLLLTLGIRFGDVARELRVWDLPAAKLRGRLGHEESIDAIRFSAEKDILATLSRGSVYVWNFLTGQLLSQLTDAGYVRDVGFSPDGRYLLTGSADNTAILWLWKTEDLRDEACKRLERNLLPSEWERYLGDKPYQKTCPNLPADASPS